MITIEFKEVEELPNQGEAFSPLKVRGSKTISVFMPRVSAKSLKHLENFGGRYLMASRE